VIGAGVTVGSGSVIAANSFVNADVPDNAVFGGSPAHRLGRVEFRDDQPVLAFDNGTVTALTKQPQI